MMRLLMICILLWCAWGCAGGENYRFTMKGRVPGMKYGTVFIRSNDSLSQVLASADLKNYEFCMKGELAESGCYVLQVNDQKRVIVMDGRELVAEFAEGRKADLKRLQGSPAQECLGRYNMFIAEKTREFSRENSVVEQREDWGALAVDDKHKQLKFEWTCAFIEENPDNIASAFIAMQEMSNDYDKGIKMYELLSERVKRLEIGKAMKRQLARFEVMAKGKDFPGIEVCSVTGDTLTLKDWSGSVWVIDFWASWCGPCREELQYLKTLYQELEGKNVKFASVSLDNSSRAWLRANEEEELAWLSVRNLYGFDRKLGICKTLDIKSIPFIVVLDKDGTIAAKSLRREALRNKLLEMLK